MARNTEKAQFMLNRYLAQRQEEGDGPSSLSGSSKRKKKRPYLASQCDDLNEADGWRQDVLREIGRLVLEIQNQGLGEHRIRDLNDEINKLMRVKMHWERRIVELGGPNYSIQGGKGGYRYYGAAKDLPGVKDLFYSGGEDDHQKKKVTKGELQRRIDGDYYGFRDDDDGVLEVSEKEAEERMRAAEEERRKNIRGTMSVEMQHPENGENDVIGSGFVAYVPLPEQHEIEARVLQTKKQQILEKYG
jgi:pre-mRNA-splicing factor ISY1